MHWHVHVGARSQIESSDMQWTRLPAVSCSHAHSPLQTWYMTVYNFQHRYYCLLISLDQKSVMESERRAALMHFSTDQVRLFAQLTFFYMYLHIRRTWWRKDWELVSPCHHITPSSKTRTQVHQFSMLYNVIYFFATVWHHVQKQFGLLLPTLVMSIGQ